MIKILLLALTVAAFASGALAEETATVEESHAGAAADRAAVVPAEDTAALEAKVGSEVIVEGVVRNIGKGPNDGITFLNFGDRRTGFVAVIFRPAYDKFPEGFEKYAQQKVRVRGSVEKYRLEIVDGESAD
jgi:hypothetical protein